MAQQQATQSRYDVVIVGGAVVGSATAYFLQSNPDFKGSVLVIERDWTYAKSATALSSASIRQQFSNPLNIRISQFGTEFIRDFHARVAVDGDAPELGFKENGYLYLGDAAGAPMFERNYHTQRENGADVVLLDRAGLDQRFPWLHTEDLVNGVYGQSGEGWFDSYGLLQGMRRKARALGAEYIENEVVDVVRDGNRISGVVLKSGETIGCGTLVNAAGTRGPAVARLAGLPVPVEPRKRCLFVFDCRTPLEGIVPLTIDTTGIFFRPEGQYYLTGCYPDPDPLADVDDFDVIHSEFDDIIWPALAARIPAFEAIKVVNAWAGHYDFSVLDHNAIVGAHPEVENFLFANGFSGHGLQQSPAIGRGLAEWIAYGEYRALDLSPLGFERVIENRPFLEEGVI
ncbi:NAD(P)/FAD-dependent oxidoreductase [Burkholderia sp. Ac-20379]|uniref:NAD(P)/FAD-dependent oxidoreductase n=1 Tax=Burkholderia sp. Ac-20379 TaxID=2703900 RepID=UPI00198062F2|nr:FAD-binding oxidoreductase [Burkholderia sp. Ac-20379]MBN3727766.1 FAD-binding oxidoreductase [Burkholderia sp. Ac-20379]